MNNIREPYPYSGFPNEGATVRTIRGTNIVKDGEYFRFHGGFSYYWFNTLEDAVEGLNQLDGCDHIQDLQDGKFGSLD